MTELHKSKTVSLKNSWHQPWLCATPSRSCRLKEGTATDAEFKQKLLEECAVYQQIESHGTVVKAADCAMSDPLKLTPSCARLRDGFAGAICCRRLGLIGCCRFCL
jgi:hypothetical protein